MMKNMNGNGLDMMADSASNVKGRKNNTQELFCLKSQVGVVCF